MAGASADGLINRTVIERQLKASTDCRCFTPVEGGINYVDTVGEALSAAKKRFTRNVACQLAS